MSERAYTTVDKTAWGTGPWTDEPDKIQYVDGPSGLDCLIVRNGGGALCGYVGVPAGHPWHSVDYDGLSLRNIDVHCGLTYSASCMEGAPEDRGICHVPDPGRPGDVWWFGFDCAHAYDLSPGHAAGLREQLPGYGGIYDVYRDLGYVRNEVRNLARQLAEVTA